MRGVPEGGWKRTTAAGEGDHWLLSTLEQRGGDARVFQCKKRGDAGPRVTGDVEGGRRTSSRPLNVCAPNFIRFCLFRSFWHQGQNNMHVKCKT